jgi:signal transduction histidine kinase
MAKIKGTGLGLFLVRNIARQHGGDATATSAGASLGATITINLPLATNVEGSRQAAPSETSLLH